MKADKNNTNLDGLIYRAISREEPKFDFDKWKQKHRQEIEIYELQTMNKQIAHSAEPFNIWRSIMKSRITKFSAAAAFAAVMVGFIIFFGFGQQTLYAQVMKGLSSARTIHVIGKSLRNGQWEKGIEAWYEQGIGVVEEHWRDGVLKTKRIDNGTHSWQYWLTSNLVKRSESFDPMGIVADILDVKKLTEKAVRDPENDKVINCERYFAYVRSNEENTYKILTWLDEAKRIRAWEKSHVVDSGQWETYRIGEVEYDVNLDSITFSTDFGPDVRIVEVDEIINEYFNLEDAFFTEEVLGHIFAVHQLKKCKGDFIYAVCSIRPTAATRSLVRASGPAVWAYGGFSLGSSWKRVDKYGRGRSYEPINLGQLYHWGLQVQLVLFYAKGFEPGGPEQCEFEVYMYTSGKLREARVAAGLPERQRFNPLAVLQLPDEQVEVGLVLDEVYSVASELEPLVAFDKLRLRSVPFTDEEMGEYIKEHPTSGETRAYRAGDRSKNARLHHGQSSKPSEINREDWVKDRIEYLQERKKSYREFLEEVQRKERRDRK